MEEIKYKDIIEMIYQAEEKTLDENIKQINKQIKSKIKDIDLEKINNQISNPKELNKILETIEENYSIKIAEYNRSFYKQGFIDGINLMINCIK